MFEKLVGDLAEKKRWKQYRARIAALPPSYRMAAEGIERYLMSTGGVGADGSVQAFVDLAELFEQAAADATSIRDIVGDDPVEFVETFAANYSKGDWRTRVKQRLVETIHAAEEQG